MKRIFYLLLPLLIFGAQWSRTYDEGVRGSAICVTEGGYVVCGTSNDGTDANGLLMKVNSSGNIHWTKSLGLDSPDAFLDLAEDGAGGFYVFGGSQSFGDTGTDFWLVRTDENGDTLWSRTYGDIGEDLPAGMDIDRDGNIIMVGSKAVYHSEEAIWTYNYWLIKVSPDGENIWSYTFGGTDEMMATSVSAKGELIVVTGQRLSDMRMHAMGISHAGFEIWEREYPGTCGNDVISVSSGGFLIVGHGTDYSLTPAAILVRIDDHGDTLWVRGHGGRNDIRDDHAVANSVTELFDGSFVVSGIYNQIYDWLYHNDALIMKVSAFGELRWLRHHGDLNNQTIFDIQTDSDCLLMAGLDDENGILIIRADRAGLVSPLEFTDNHYLVGNLFDASSGFPISGASVELYASLGATLPIYKDTTDIFGSFFLEVGEDVFYLSIPSYYSYTPYFHPGTKNPLEAVPFDFDSSSPPNTWLDIGMMQTSDIGTYAVSGMVSTIDFDEIDRCHVIAISSDEVEDEDGVVSTRTDSTGAYVLPLPSGNWFVYAYQDSFIPMFHGGNFLWEEAAPLLVSEVSIFDINFELPPEDYSTGSNTIEINVEMAYHYFDTPAFSVIGCRVYLTDLSGTPLRSGVTDLSGHLTMNNVPSGDFMLFADKVNYSMVSPEEIITVDSDTAIIVDIGLIHGIRGISEPEDEVIEESTSFMSVYPNPAQNIVEINFQVFGGNTILKLHDITGREVYSKNLGFLSQGSHAQQIDISKLPNGEYLASSVCDGVSSVSRKLFLRH